MLHIWGPHISLQKIHKKRNAFTMKTVIFRIPGVEPGSRRSFNWKRRMLADTPYPSWLVWWQICSKFALVMVGYRTHETRCRLKNSQTPGEIKACWTSRFPWNLWCLIGIQMPSNDRKMVPLVKRGIAEHRTLRTSPENMSDFNWSFGTSKTSIHFSWHHSAVQEIDVK